MGFQRDLLWQETAYLNGQAKYTPITALWLIYYGYRVVLVHLSWQKSYMALLRNIDCIDTYTSSSFIIDNFIQAALSIFVECMAQCVVFIPLQCGWLRCFSAHIAPEAQGAFIGCD